MEKELFKLRINVNGKANGYKLTINKFQPEVKKIFLNNEEIKFWKPPSAERENTLIKCKMKFSGFAW